MSDANEALGKDMQEEATEELLCCQRHRLSFLPLRVILVLEYHLAILKMKQPLIGDRDTVGVSSQVTEDLLGSAKGWFGVDDPVASIQTS